MKGLWGTRVVCMQENGHEDTVLVHIPQSTLFIYRVDITLGRVFHF